MKSITNIRISGTGSCVPEWIISNDYLALFCDTNDQWVRENIGIKERRRIYGHQQSSDLAAEAALRAIEAANLFPDSIGMIIVATSTPDKLAPSTACIVQNEIEAWNAFCFDINAVCAGFLVAMSTAALYVSQDVVEHALVIGVDTFSKYTDFSKRDAVFFGDGAGAVVISKHKKGMFNFDIYSDGSGKDSFSIPHGGYFQMNGKEVYKAATRFLPEAIESLMVSMKLCSSDIDIVIPHQPSIQILRETARRVDIPFDKVMTNMDKYANTAAATIPLLLDETVRAGKINKGDIVLFAAIGSGWVWGAAILEWA